MVTEIRQQKAEQEEELIQLRAKHAVPTLCEIQWKQDGNKFQYNVIQKLLQSSLQARAFYRAGKVSTREKQLDEHNKTCHERIKMLRIADSSQYEWQTVAEYQINPVAVNEADDQKIKRAEKTAQAQKNQEKRQKYQRFQPYNRDARSSGNRTYNNNDGQQQDYRSIGCFKNNNACRQASVVPEKTVPHRNINNDMCFN